MSIDSENTSTPTTESPATKGRKPAKKAKPAKKVTGAKKAAGKPKADRTNKKAEGHRHDEARQGSHVTRDHEGHGLAGAYRTRVRQHPGQQRRREDRVVQEHRGRTDVQDREIASGNSSSKRRLGHAPGAAFLLSGASK